MPETEITIETILNALMYESGDYYPDDAARIVEVVSRTWGATITPGEAARIWEWYSDEYWAAGWMHIEDGDAGDAEIVRAVTYFVRAHYREVTR